MLFTTSRCAILVLAVLLALSSVAIAQDIQALEVGKTYRLAADHSGVNVTAFRVYVDGVKVGEDLPASALTAGVVTTSDLPGLTAGAHSLQLAAVNGDREAKSAPLAVTVEPKTPDAPTNLRLVLEVIRAADGSLSFKLVEVKK